MGDWNEPVSQVSRVLLRIEWADGQVREFEAEEPRGLEVSIGRREPPPGLAEWLEERDGPAARLYQPERPLVPQAIYGGPAAGVSVIFQANEDCRRHPFTVRIPDLRSAEQGGLTSPQRGNPNGHSRPCPAGNIPCHGGRHGGGSGGRGGGA